MVINAVCLMLHCYCNQATAAANKTASAPKNDHAVKVIVPPASEPVSLQEMCAIYGLTVMKNNL